MVDSETSSCSSSTALRTARPGVDEGKISLLIKALVSMTRRWRIFIGEQLLQNFRGHAASSGLFRNPVAEPLKFGHTQRAETLVFLCGQYDGDIAIMATDHHRLALCRVEHGGQILLGLGSRNGTHQPILLPK